MTPADLTTMLRRLERAFGEWTVDTAEYDGDDLAAAWSASTDPKARDLISLVLVNRAALSRLFPNDDFLAKIRVTSVPVEPPTITNEMLAEAQAEIDRERDARGQYRL